MRYCDPKVSRRRLYRLLSSDGGRHPSSKTKRGSRADGEVSPLRCPRAQPAYKDGVDNAGGGSPRTVLTMRSSLRWTPLIFRERECVSK